MKKILLILFSCQLVFSCDKDAISPKCQTLQDGILDNDIDKVRTAINHLIDGLPDKTYNEANLTILVQKISSQCDVTCEIGCFDCIQTLPGQSEIRIIINTGSGTVGRTIDLSYAANNDMIFRNMHN